MANLKEQYSLSYSHLNLILGEKHAWSTLFGNRNGKPNQIISFTDNEVASKEAIRLTNLGYNIYFTPNTMSSKPPEGRRGSDKDITTQYAIIVDIDIEGCDNHSSTEGRRYAPNIQTALSFLTLEPSLIVHTGYGLQVYYILSSPRTVNKLSKKVAKLFIREVQQKAKELGYIGVDSTYSISHQFRLPGTKNFKLVNGKLPKEIPICKVIKVSNVRYDFEQLQERFIVSTPNPIEDQETPDRTKPTKVDLQWALYFFRRIAASRLSYEQWRNAIWIGHAVGVDPAILDNWSKADNARYAGTGSIEKLISEYQDNGLGVGTLINYLKQLEPSDPFIIPLTYEGYAIQLHYFYGDTLKYVVDSKKWAFYEDNVWNMCDSPLPELSRIPINLTRSLKALSTFTDNKICKFINAWTDSVVFEKALKIYGGLHMKKSTDFNTERHLLNVQNGVIDLRTGALLPHDPKYHFTYKLDTPYIPLSSIGVPCGDTSIDKGGSAALTASLTETRSSVSAYSNPGVPYGDTSIDKGGFAALTAITKGVPVGDTSELYSNLLKIQDFFKSIIPDKNTRNALLRYLGYCLTGEIGEQTALFIYGRGANGKTTLLNIIYKLLIPYVTDISSEVLTFDSKDPSKATPQLQDLEYKRLGVISELKESSTLQSIQLKKLVGEDRLTIRPLYSKHLFINIYFKLILSGNYQMELTDANDIGVQRRIIQVNFTKTLEKLGIRTFKLSLLLPTL